MIPAADQEPTSTSVRDGDVPAAGQDAAGKLGVFIVGARGSVSTTSILGAIAIARGLATRAGMVTAARELAALPLVEPADMVFGGTEIRSGTLREQATALAAERVLPGELVDELGAELDEVDRRIVGGHLHRSGKAIEELAAWNRADPESSPREIVQGMQAALQSFRVESGASRVVLVNLASTEPRPPVSDGDLSEFEAALAAGDPDGVLCLSSLLAYAAIDAGVPYINFTPSAGASISALRQLSELRGVPHAGRDGKTGETLLKTVLAPMFVARGLEVAAWQGYNMLGNTDGVVLKEPENLATKAESKDVQLRSIMGAAADIHTGVRIDYVPTLGEWKTAWDFIQFRGFLGTMMNMQFTWNGCDSTLAAPLVLDLIRLTDLASRRGEKGALPHLACFFKNPEGTDVHDFGAQMALLRAYAETAAATTRA